MGSRTPGSRNSVSQCRGGGWGKQGWGWGMSIKKGEGRDLMGALCGGPSVFTLPYRKRSQTQCARRDVNRKHCSQKLREAAGLMETETHPWGQLWRTTKGRWKG